MLSVAFIHFIGISGDSFATKLSIHIIFFFQAEDGIRDYKVTGVQTCALPISAANAGIAAATGSFVSFLDDDDLVEPEHLATLAGLTAAAGARVVYTDAAVGVYELDPDGGWRQAERRLPYSRDLDPELLLLDNSIPFHTLLVERELPRAAGPLDPSLPFFEDWDLLIRLSRLAPFHHLARVTCEYRHFRGGGHVFGERPRERPDFLAVKQRVLERHRALLTPETLARVVDRLRAEVV